MNTKSALCYCAYVSDPLVGPQAFMYSGARIGAPHILAETLRPGGLTQAREFMLALIYVRRGERFLHKL
jgi:hypothetical protein